MELFCVCETNLKLCKDIPAEMYLEMSGMCVKIFWNYTNLLMLKIYVNIMGALDIWLLSGSFSAIQYLTG